MWTAVGLHVADVLVLIQYIVRRRFSLLQGVDGATAGYPKLGDVHQYILFCLSISFLSTIFSC